MALVRWKWVDYLNIELYEHNLKQREALPQLKLLTGYDSDEDLFFERINSDNLRRFLEADDLIQRMALQRQYIIQEQQRLILQLYYNAYRIPEPPPDYSPVIRHVRNRRGTRTESNTISNQQEGS